MKNLRGYHDQPQSLEGFVAFKIKLRFAFPVRLSAPLEGEQETKFRWMFSFQRAIYYLYSISNYDSTQSIIKFALIVQNILLVKDRWFGRNDFWGDKDHIFVK